MSDKSPKYGIKQSLHKLAIKYSSPRVEHLKPEHLCSTCEREKKEVEAIDFCKECNDKLCTACVKQHGKFQLLKNHQIVKVTDVFTETKQRPATKLTDTCPIHVSILLNQYCPAHDEVGCLECIAAYHSECKEPLNVTKAAAGLLKTSIPKETKDEILKIKKDLSMLKLKRLEDKRRLKKEKDIVVTTVMSLRKKLDSILDRLESSAKEKLTKKFERGMKRIKRDVKIVDDAIADFDEILKKLKTDQEAQMFVRIKSDAKYCQKRGKEIVDALTEHVGNEELNFTVDETLESCLDNLIGFGKFDQDQNVFIGSLYGQYNASFEKDAQKEDYAFNGSVNLPDGRTILSDWNNKKIKIFDTAYKPKSHLELAGSPYSMCYISSDEILVTLRDEKIIQFISIDENGKMEATKKFKIDEYPRGIGYHKNEIYITCGGGVGEINGQFRVYSMSGELTKVYEDDIHGQRIFLSPKDIVVEQTRVHVVDRKRGIITITNEGRVMSVFSDPHLKDPFGLCIDDMGNLFAIGAESNNVMQLTGDGEKVAEVLKESDGISNLLSICCHVSVNPRLILTFEHSNEFSVFTLGEK